MADLKGLVPLFDAYRIFYGKRGDLQLAEVFLQTRLERSQSIIFIAEACGGPMGFVQLYPSFSSLSAGPILVLSDLFVWSHARSKGVGEALLAAARTYGQSAGAHCLSLATAFDNGSAQRLYERTGWKRETQFVHYDLRLAAGP